jgi:hypothetical protein
MCIDKMTKHSGATCFWHIKMFKETVGNQCKVEAQLKSDENIHLKRLKSLDLLPRPGNLQNDLFHVNNVFLNQAHCWMRAHIVYVFGLPMSRIICFQEEVSSRRSRPTTAATFQSGSLTRCLRNSWATWIHIYHTQGANPTIVGYSINKTYLLTP